MNENEASSIMGINYVGSKDLVLIKDLGLNADVIPTIPFEREELEEKKNDYVLILGVDRFANGLPVTIRNIRAIVGMDSAKREPCFYNQDWYEKEEFIDVPMKSGWYLIRKNVYDNSRAILPDELERDYKFPSAISCTYAFFVSWYVRGIKLWVHDFVWCCDKDHNGDRIYVGKYHDIDGVNKNGFSIHRHLSLRKCYGCID